LEISQETPRVASSRSAVRLVTGVLLAGLAVGGLFLAIRWALGLPQMPYNVRELFPKSHRDVHVAVFSVWLVWLGVAPAWVGDFLAVRSRQILFMPLWAAAIGLASWFMLAFSVTRESLGDILGAPTLGWGGDWELMCRFAALQGTWTIALLIAGATGGTFCRRGWRAGFKRLATASLCGAPWLVLAWTTVVGWANTDNLTELIRATPGKWVGPCFLAVLVGMIAMNASALSYAWGGRGGWRKLRAMAIAPLLIAPGWGLLWLGLEPAVQKYGTTFPAARFLLGPDRETVLSLGELAFRWGCVQLGLVVVLTLGGVIALGLRPRRDGASGLGEGPGADLANRDVPGRWRRRYMVLAILWAACLLYGSLIPLNIQPMGLDEAFDTFGRAMRLTEQPSGKADTVTNVAMIIPLTFSLMGSCWRRGGRYGRGWQVPLIVIGAAGLSFVLEFGQVYVPGRSTSGHDLIAQTVGSVLGLAGWMAFGGALTQWFDGLFGESDRSALGVKLLWAYLVLFVLYSVIPPYLTLSVAQVWHKYKSGMITLVPFSGPGELNIVAVAMKTIVYVPIGYLFAIRAGRLRRPRLAAVVGGLVFAGAMELAQVLILPRVATVTDVMLGMAGAWIGGMMAWGLGPIATGRGLHGPWWGRWGVWFKLPAVVGMVALMACQHWDGLVVRRSADAMAQGLGVALSRPVGSIFNDKGPLEAASRLVQEFGAFLLLGMLLQSLFSRRRMAVVAGLVLVLSLELGRLALSRYLPDATMTVAGLAGAMASLWGYRCVVSVFLTPSALAEASESGAHGNPLDEPAG